MLHAGRGQGDGVQPSIDGVRPFMHYSCMSKTITIEDDVYELLASLKEDSRDSFTRVIRRHLPRRCDTAGELLDVYEHAPLPKVNWDVLDKLAAGRGRRSGGRK